VISAAQASISEAIPRRRVIPRPIALAGAALLVLSAFLALSGSSASAACPNEALRTGYSEKLPECRAFELVTDPGVRGIPEAAAGFGTGLITFNTPSVAPDGESYVYKLVTSGLPGPEASGFANLYEARRSATGWTSVGRSPGGTQAIGFETGGISQDQHFLTFEINSSRGGSLAFCETCNPIYVGYPDGSYHLLGEGTIPTLADTDGFENGLVDDPHALARWITAGAEHQIFESPVQLLPEAPADGTLSVYDRTPQGLNLISRLPVLGEPGNVQEARMVGASADGSTVLFTTAEDGLSPPDLFARIDNAKTVELASHLEGPLRVGGVNADGSLIYFVKSGEIFVYDVGSETASALPGTAGATLVGISGDGSHAYFVSEDELVPGEGTTGERNLYVWTGSGVQFIATVTEYDMEHSIGAPGEFQGLAAWTQELAAGYAAEGTNRLLSTLRTTPDGRFLVFESNANLTSYPSEGFTQIYRYDAVTEDLVCVSCSPIASAATAANELGHAGISGASSAFLNLNRSLDLANLSEDGQQVVWQSDDSLVAADNNGVADVYQWRNGQLALISTGTDPLPVLLTGVSPSGNDIFFRTGVPLVGTAPSSGSPAIYDARVNGGFAGQQPVPPLVCQGEACQGLPATPPSYSQPGSSTFHGKGNVKKHKKKKHKHKKKKHKKKGTQRNPRQGMAEMTRSAVAR
jgi:WD40-like Beta Propeller Repeat